MRTEYWWTASTVPRWAAGDSVVGSTAVAISVAHFIDMRDREGIVQVFSIRIVRMR